MKSSQPSAICGKCEKFVESINRRNYGSAAIASSTLPGVLSKQQAKDLAIRLTSDERDVLISALQECQSDTVKAEYEGNFSSFTVIHTFSFLLDINNTNVRMIRIFHSILSGGNYYVIVIYLHKNLVPSTRMNFAPWKIYTFDISSIFFSSSLEFPWNLFSITITIFFDYSMFSLFNDSPVLSPLTKHNLQSKIENLHFFKIQ